MKSWLLRCIKQYKRTFFIYIFVGGGCALVNWAVFYLLLLCHIHFVIAAVLAFLVSCTLNFILCKKIFYSAGRRKREEFALIVVVSIIALSVDLSTMYVLVTRLFMAPLLAKMLGTATAFLINYSLRQFFIFSPVPLDKREIAS